MSRDYMTNGLASWIACGDQGTTAAADRRNPWETGFTKDSQRAPIADSGGLAIFRKTFSVRQLVSARVDATALGVFELFCNGARVGRRENGEEVFDELKPGWTEYRKRALYFSYDLTPYLREGDNVLTAAVGPGWYNGRISMNTYGETHVAFLGAIRLSDADGERALYTDDTWTTYRGGAVRASDIWDGELYDASEPSLASLSDGANVAWQPVLTETHDIFVTPHIGPTIMMRAGLTRRPKTLTIFRGTEDNGSDFGRIHTLRTLENTGSFLLAKGETVVVDLGQNIVGRPRVTVRGAARTAIRIRFGEMLNDSGLSSRGNDDAEGSVYSLNYRSAKSKICYLLNGSEDGERYSPIFTFFGFRYLQIDATDDVEFLDLDCPVIGSATRETGRMVTSDDGVNRLISNILWGQRGNYLSIPTDCPQRDERLGWTGDTEAFCRTAAYNADVDGFFRKWLQDARDSQADSGMYPDVIPHVRVVGWGGAAWSDAGIIVPHTMWRMYGDTELLEAHYPSMERYMDWLAGTDFAGPTPTYGDWLAYEPTDPRYISMAYYALDARYMAEMSDALRLPDRAAHYTELYGQIRARFRKRYCGADGCLKPEFRTQTGYLLALRNDLLDPADRPAAVAALKQKIIGNGYRLSTGFVGSCILCEILAEFGENNLAYSLLLQTADPSWLYSVLQGATTVWERWNSYTKARGFGDVGMNSFNHYAYGSVQEWMYRHIAGIEEAEPGFASLLLQPKPDTRAPSEIPAGQQRMTFAKTSFESRHGRIVSDWDTRDGFVYRAVVPVVTELRLPVLSSGETFMMNGAARRFDEFDRTEDGAAVIIRLDPGSYEFTQA